MCDRRPEKPVDHVTVADWDARIQELRETARRRRKEAHDLRQESIQLRADTAVTTHWSLLQSSQSLQDRCTEVRRVEHLLELKRAATVCEMERLEEEKAMCQRQLELLSVPRAVTVECQLAIDQRLDTDLLRDPVHLQLQKVPPQWPPSEISLLLQSVLLHFVSEHCFFPVCVPSHTSQRECDGTVSVLEPVICIIKGHWSSNCCVASSFHKIDLYSCGFPIRSFPLVKYDVIVSSEDSQTQEFSASHVDHDGTTPYLTKTNDDIIYDMNPALTESWVVPTETPDLVDKHCMDFMGLKEYAYVSSICSISLLSGLAVLACCKLAIFFCKVIPSLSTTETSKELGLIEQKKNDLEAECKAAWEQLQRLGECLNQLSRDLQNKGEAIAVDESALGLKPSSSGIGFRQDPTRHPKECIPYETWQQVSESNMNRAEEEIQKSRSQRLNMFSLRADVTNSLHAQHSDTEHALSRRIYEVQRAHDELQWQKEETENEMGVINREISLLEEALADKTGPSKLAESRLEIRLWRPRAELLYDDAQQTIKNELLQLQLSRQKLTQQIADAKATYNALQQHSVRLAADIDCKNQALTLLNRCCDIRSALHPDER
ncbi:uncharacterized protein LOC126355623 [Schistocerca gregaria]|uniref:uncharacterized protein LOC126355623 n=1 Tax=Schistocerca gregaria TaxID=7010 RepID=UPI00211F334C|nr:uncharacterized protein LOC126355623 [Schistocerca gregaria]